MQVDDTAGVSASFAAFLSQAPGHADAWMQAVKGLDGACALDPKTRSLAYLAVLAALGRESGVPFHAAEARRAGATRAEVISAVLVGLPASGNTVIASLPPALAVYDLSPARPDSD
jgi:alkylhydroperoxidase/carboxymuconolactone decarboxylase family protein YurZ